MKTTMRFLFMAMLSILMMASSCKKDDPDPPGPPNPTDTRIVVKGSVCLTNANIQGIGIGFVLERDEWGYVNKSLSIYGITKTSTSAIPNNFSFEFKIPKEISDTLVIGKAYDMCLGANYTRNDSTLIYESSGLTIMKNPLDMGVNFSNHTGYTK